MSDVLRTEIVNKLVDKRNNSIAIVTHNSPDGDAIGSAVGLELILKAMGKQVDLILQTKASKRFAPLLGKDRVDTIILPPKNKVYDISFLVDCSDPARAYEHVPTMARCSVVIDHHVPMRYYGDIYLYEQEPATGLIIYKLVQELASHAPKLDEYKQHLADALLTSFKTDTGSFNYSNTTSSILTAAAELIEWGASPTLNYEMFSDNTYGFMTLLGEVLGDLSFRKDVGLITGYVTCEQVARHGTTFDEAALAIDYVRAVEGAEVALLFIEGQDKIRIRARSKNRPVNVIMQHFGGNGHEKAAGAAISNRSLEVAMRDVTRYTVDYMKMNK